MSENIFEPKEKFHLSEKFLEQYKNKQPKWGPLGYFVYKRSYAREKDPNTKETEEFWETLKRVVEGCYTVQLNHCRNNRLRWNAMKSQKSAQEMFKLMWEFKFLPPGRGLFAMGSDVVWKKGVAALMNCAFISTENMDFDPSYPFEFMSDVSMFGIGTGFDLLGAKKDLIIKQPKTSNDCHIVDDSREGWVEIIKRIIDAHFGKNTIPNKIDYSQIRPKGSPIKTFGGIAPGPGPLELCIKELMSIFNGERDLEKQRFLYNEFFRELYIGLVYYPFLLNKRNGIIEDKELFQELVGSPYLLHLGLVNKQDLIEGVTKRDYVLEDNNIQNFIHLDNFEGNKDYLKYTIVCLKGIYKYISSKKQEEMFNNLSDIFNRIDSDNINYQEFTKIRNFVNEQSNILFDEKISRYGSKLTSLDILDWMNIIGKCIVSGGIRRVAQIALGECDDLEYLTAKDPESNLFELFKWRWASNNSLVVNGKKFDYDKLGQQSSINGEPGYIWIENARKYGRIIDPPNYKDYRVSGVNPCGEQSLEATEWCNLVETFPAHHETLKEYLNTLKYAYLYAKTVTLIPSHREDVNQIILRNRRIGLSQSGIIQSFQKHGIKEHLNWSDEGYKYINELDKKYSDWLCIPKSIKTTSVKPSGTISLLCGATPGIHYPHSQYYYRTVRIPKESNLYHTLIESNYRVEESIYGDNSWVVYFAVEEKNFERSKKEVSIWEQISNAILLQKYWSDNQVSITVTFDKEQEGKDIPKILEIFGDQLKAISFLPLGKKSYPQAPYQEISKVEYLEYTSKLKSLNFVNSTSTNEVQEKFCDGDSCTI